MSPWIILDSGSRTGYENMHLDEWFARSWFPETKQPVFRLYGWSPYTLSLGYHQSEDDIDIENLFKSGYDFVRRPTGGRAVFHAQEITYSVVLDATRSSVDEIYERISRVLVTGLKSAGYDVAFAGTKQNFSSLYRDKKSVSCFTASSEYEIQLNGRKLVGSAQRRYARPDGGVTALQHGSILTGPAHHQLLDFLTLHDQLKLKLSEVMKRSSTDLTENGTREVDISRIKSLLTDAVINELAGGEYEKYDHDFFISQMSKVDNYSTELRE
jgi:lipoyl(octanoyl) transferase